LRAIHRDLCVDMGNQLPDEAVSECCNRLNLRMEDETLAPDPHSGLSMVMDYCIHDYRWNRRSVLERYASQGHFGPNSDERLLLYAML
ncbi:MAG: hypothetical protein DRI39_09590, partial [Chloroflexi bacterium]